MPITTILASFHKFNVMLGWFIRLQRINFPTRHAVGYLLDQLQIPLEDLLG